MPFVKIFVFFVVRIYHEGHKGCTKDTKIAAVLTKGHNLSKFHTVNLITVVVAAIISAICTLLGGGSIELAVIFLLLAANVGTGYAILALSKKDDTQQTQIDDLKRELEEMKGKQTEPQS